MYKNIAFVIPDMKSKEYAFFVSFMTNLAENGFEIYALTDSRSTEGDFRYSPKIKRLPLNAPIKKRYTRYQVLDYYVHQLDNCLFVVFEENTKDINVIYQKHKAVYLDKSEFCNPMTDKELSIWQMQLLKEELFEMPVLECSSPGPIKEELSLVKKMKGFIRHAEEKRYSKYTYIQLTDEDVKKSQQLALSMLWEFKRLCEKHNLKYYLAAGSLLGAARDGKIIPWDDDVDVTMPRRDYEKFLKIARKELNKSFVISKSNFPYGFQRMQVRGTNIERIVRQKKPHGVFMDILPLDCAPLTKEDKRDHQREDFRLKEIMFDISYPQPILAFNKAELKKWLRRLFRKIFYSKRRLMRKWLKNATRFESPIATEWVCLPGYYGYSGECFPKEYWGEGTTLKYEGVECKVMCEWEKYLKAHHGDYMQVPHELLRRTHRLFSIEF